MSKIYRIGITVAAIIIGILLIKFLTNIGNQSKGPLEDLFVKTGSYVSDLEQYLMDEKSARYKELDWFASHRNLAKLKSPTKIIFGAFDNKSTYDYQSIIALEKSLNTTFPMIHFYTAWGSELGQRFPLTQVKAVHDLGSIPMITWEPWLIDFDQEAHPELRDVETRDKGGLRDIANGVYDFYLEKWMLDLKQFKHPVFVRMGHEMNDPYRYTWGPQNNKPEDFVAAWQHVVNYFKKSGIDNIIWVWSPHIAYGSFDAYYPGDEYVDWVGVGTLNYGTVATWSNWWTFEEIFGRYYPGLDKFNKPIMLSEFGSLAVGGDREAWYRNAICEIPQKYPNLKALLFFHFNKDNTLTYQTLDWYFKDDTLITKSIVNCIEGWPDSLQGK